MLFRRATKMRVVTVDGNGKELGDARWVEIPKPEKFRSEGFAQIENYISRLLKSSARFNSLIIARPNGQMAVSVMKRGKLPWFSAMVNWRSEPERERAIMDFFAQRGLSTTQDYLAGNGEVPDAIRCLAYSLPADVQFITAITKEVLREVYHLREEEGLNFTFQEDHDAV